MDITETKSGNVTVAALKGRLDTATATWSPLPWCWPKRWPIG